MRKAKLHQGRKYNSPSEAIFTEGIAFQHEPYTAKERALILDVLKGARPWEAKHCYYNSQDLAMADERLEYAEGFVLSDGLPMALDHAWNFIPESGKPVDLTMRELREKTTCDPKLLLARAERNLKNAYLGVVIPTDELKGHWLKSGYAESMLQAPENLWSIIRQGFPGTWGVVPDRRP